MKYYVNQAWTPQIPNVSRTFTPVGYQKSYYVKGPLTFPSIGEPTTLGNRKDRLWTIPYDTSPQLGANHIDRDNVDVNSKLLGFGIGEPTNLKSITRNAIRDYDSNQYEFVDSNLVQNPKNIIFTNGVIPVGGISTRNELRNFVRLNQC